MSLKSWWKRATKIPSGGARGIIGNLVKNVSPFLALTPVGAIGAGVAAAAGEGIRNPKANLGDLAKAGLTNATLGAGINKGVGLLKSASSGAPPVLSPGAPSVTGSAGDIGGLPSGNIEASRSLGARITSPLRSAVSSAGSFAKDNSMATAMGLQAASNLATAGAENRAQNAQARLLEQQAGESEYEFAQRKARDLALEPLRRALAGQIGRSVAAPRGPVAPNPYAVQG